MSVAPISIHHQSTTDSLSSPFHISPVSFRIFSPSDPINIFANDPLSDFHDTRVEDEKHCTGYTCCGMHLTDMHALLDHYENGHKSFASRQHSVQVPARPLAISTAYNTAQDVEPEFDMDMDDTDTDSTSPRTPLNSHRSSPALINPALSVISQVPALPSGPSFFHPQSYSYPPYSPTTPITPHHPQYSRYEANDQPTIALHNGPDLRPQWYHPTLPQVQPHGGPVSRPLEHLPPSILPASHSSVVPPQLHSSHTLLVQNPYLNGKPLPPHKPIIPPSLYNLANPVGTTPSPSTSHFAPHAQPEGVDPLDSSASSPLTEDDEDAEGEDEDVMDPEADGVYGHIPFAQTSPIRGGLSREGSLSSSKAKASRARRPSAARPGSRKSKALGGGRKPADPTKEKLRCPREGCTKLYTNQNGLKYHLEKGTCTNAVDRGY